MISCAHEIKTLGNPVSDNRKHTLSKFRYASAGVAVYFYRPVSSFPFCRVATKPSEKLIYFRDTSLSLESPQ